MKAGTIIRLPDGREGTVVYHGLGGYGIQWGRIKVTVEDIEDAMQGANTLFGEPPDDYPYYAEAMLREPYPHADIECVGERFEVMSVL